METQLIEKIKRLLFRNEKAFILGQCWETRYFIGYKYSLFGTKSKYSLSRKYKNHQRIKKHIDPMPHFIELEEGIRKYGSYYQTPVNYTISGKH